MRAAWAEGEIKLPGAHEVCSKFCLLTTLILFESVFVYWTLGTKTVQLHRLFFFECILCARHHVNTKIEGTITRKILISHKGLYLDGQHRHETNHKAVWILSIKFYVHVLDKVLREHERKLRGGSHIGKGEEYQTFQTERKITTALQLFRNLILPCSPRSLLNLAKQPIYLNPPSVLSLCDTVFSAFAGE